jgi:protease I
VPDLNGKRVAILATDMFEQVELVEPRKADEDAVRFVRSFFEQGKPVAAICHAPWLLVEADVVRGRNLTSFGSVETDIRNAGGNWSDEEVVVDEGLVTSRSPKDLPAFCAKVVEEFAEGRHEGQRVPARATTRGRERCRPKS